MSPVFNNFKGLAMQKPTQPPETGNDTSSRFWQELEAKLAPLEDYYLHWHDLQQKKCQYKASITSNGGSC